jgi:hypothetical protein
MTFLGRFSDVSKAWLQCLFSKFNRCNYVLNFENKHLSYALETSENMPRNVIVRPLKLTPQLFALNGLPESAVNKR